MGICCICVATYRQGIRFMTTVNGWACAISPCSATLGAYSTKLKNLALNLLPSLPSLIGSASYCSPESAQLIQFASEIVRQTIYETKVAVQMRTVSHSAKPGPLVLLIRATVGSSQYHLPSTRKVFRAKPGNSDASVSLVLSMHRRRCFGPFAVT